MLDNEPNAGATGPDGETIEQPEVTRRRRSSRPAGPPPELPEEPASAPVTVAAAQSAPSVADVQAVQRNAAQRAAGEPGAEMLAAATASAEAGAGAPAVAGGSATGTGATGTGTAGSGTAAGPVPEGESVVEAAVAEAVAEAEKPKRATRTRSTATTTRRRTTKKAAEEQADAAGALPEGETPAETAAEVAEEPVKRRRTRKKAEPEETVAAEAVEGSAALAGGLEGGRGADVAGAVSGRGTGAGADTDEAVGAVGGTVGEAGAAAGASESETAAAAGGTTRAGRARTTRTRGAKARAEDAAAVQGAEGASVDSGRAAGSETAEANGRGAGADVAAAEGVEEADDDILEILPEDEPLDDEPAGEDLDEETERPSLLSDPFGLTARRQDQPGASYQRPAAIFAPLFQAPDPSKGKPAATKRAEPPQPVAEPKKPEKDEKFEEPVEEPVAEDEVEDETELDTSDDQEEEGGGRRRRRRRGGRGRGKARERDESEDGEESDDDSDEEQGEDSQDEEASSSRRRRRRRRRGGDEGSEPASDDPPNTVVRIRAPRSGRAASHDIATDGVQSVRGSTRLEAKKQRRREGRELGRRRPPIITESEFLARRESVDRMMVVRRQGDRTQIAVLEDGVLVEHYVNREASQSYVGNVYLGKVQNVLPSMEAAFVDIGKGRNAVLYAGEVNFDTAGLEGQPKRIEAALKSGQSVLVQVTKDPIGHKGARLTSQISLPGRYLVYVPDGSMTGISRKLPDKERTRLKSILKKVMPENAGVIVRTAAEGASEDELARDVARLSAQWESIQKKAKSASPPELLSAEPDLTIRVVRDVFNEDFTSLVVQGDEAWDTVDDYVKYVAPHLGERLSQWDGSQGDVFESYRIDEQLGKALDRKVWLPSGGSLVIDRTEAMTVVDVNTGKFTGQGGNLEETVTRNNLEAAEEIVRQLRLRDIGGIIVIDFIDMVLESNRDLVLRRLLECLARDRTKHQVAEVTSLGLVQMTRKRVGQGLLEAFSTPCDCCNGRGLLISTEPVETKSEARGTQGKMAVEKAVSDKVSAAKDSSGRDTVTGALEDVPAEDDQANQTSGRGRRRSRRAKSAD
ncbi:ribonuclease E [Nonomuraea solani]|uniref:Ribonuclease E n=1 Tax=Nonomuraea solani TaxID=1144553 RepID=A0A1H6F1A2_9ACTN|nr:Rne/Rng family ribonuclease [Nonomuraea solani]SEH02875.1 ribonuclease E [Nonomuraea solani]